MKENTNEAALEQYMAYQTTAMSRLRSLEEKLTDNVAPQDVGWGHVTWIADLAAKLRELDENW